LTDLIESASVRRGKVFKWVRYSSLRESANRSSMKKHISMKRMGFLLLVWVPLVFSLWFQEARCDFVLHPLEDFYTELDVLKLRIQPAYYTTRSNLPPNGGASVPLAGGSYTRYQMDAIVQYGLTRNLAVFLRLVSSVVSLSTAPAILSQSLFGLGSMSSAPTQSLFGLNDQSVGLAYRLFGNSSAISLEVQLQGDIPAYPSSYASTNPLIRSPSLGDGTFDGTGAVFMKVPWIITKNTSFYTQFGGGYTYRSGGFSSALPWILFFGYAPRDFVENHFFSTLGFQGFYSLKTDLDNNINAPLRVGYGSVGSYMGGAVNPSLAQLKVQLGYRLHLDQEIAFSWMQVLWGQDVPLGFYGALSLQMHFGDLFRSKVASVAVVSEKKEAANAGFVNYAIEAKVTRVSDRLNLLRIDKGTLDGIVIGDVFDVFQKNATDQEEAVARARVSHLKDQEAALKIEEYYRETWIEEGNTVKRLMGE